jgi:hypothetical protein
MDTSAFLSVITDYQPTLEINTKILNEFDARMRANPKYLEHREWILANQSGYGEHAFHWMWKLITDSMPYKFAFLEIGVYCGQIPSLIQMMCLETGKEVEMIGISPLAGGGPEGFPMFNYEEKIEMVFNRFNLPMDNLTVIQGYSQDPRVLKKLEGKEGYFDIVFIDGSHKKEDVIFDIVNYEKFLKVGGLMVTDDSSNYLPMPTGRFAGMVPVSDAVEETLGKWPNYKHLFACLHDRVWRKLS